MKKALPILWTIGALCGITALITWFSFFGTGNPIDSYIEDAFERFEDDLEIAVPAASNASDPDSPSRIIINILADGSFRVNGRELSENQLANLVRAVADGYPDQEMLLRGDAKTDFADIIRVLDLIKKAGLWNIAFATPEPAAQG